jgi:hypothetical protein
MKRNFIKNSLVVIGTFGSLHVFAEDWIQITVVATDKAAAVGFFVEGKKAGGLGKTYSGKGPVNKEYSFGYRNRVIGGDDIPCGTLFLNKNSQVKLVTKGEQCHSIIN